MIPAEVPGTVHTDLLKAKLIPDPFWADNELGLDWIQQNNWQYWTKFDLPREIKTDTPIFLVFEGVDTISEIFLNGNMIGSTENMFRQYEFAVGPFLKRRDNILLVRFTSATRYGQKMEKELGKLPVALNSERVYLRKAQYSFGWDWGPSLPTMGIWRPVYLLQPEKIRIKYVHFRVERLLPGQAQVLVQIEVIGNPRDIEIHVNLEDKHGSFQSRPIRLQKKKIQVRMTIDNPGLWWPNGEGDPHLYHLNIFLSDQQRKILDHWQGRVGIRIIKLVLKEKNKPAFTFSINGRNVFIKGVNWIPADSFLPRVNTNVYQSLLELARDAHINMVRVWGGGIYEDDQFYQLCDELGLLVWQDFMFACGAYPESPEFIKNVSEEIKQNVHRLQYHPSIAIWCGNNENEWIWFQKNQKSLNEMPGFKLYHQVIPKIIADLDPTRPYWPTTPFGDDPDPNSEKSGNRHQWDIWSNWKDYAEVKEDQSLFVTEFGFQAPANRQALEKCLPVKERSMQSRVFEFHNKQIEGNERLIRFLAAHLPISSGWADYIYLTQLNQGLALKQCIEHWRLRYPKTAGAIIWQLNDCWPVCSWSLIDWRRTPKLAYYFVKEAFSPVAVMANIQNSQLDFIILNDSPNKFTGKMQAVLFENSTGKMAGELNMSMRINEGGRKWVENKFSRNIKHLNGWICVISLYDQNNSLVHRNCYSNWRWKHIKLPEPEIQLRKDNRSDQPALLLSTSKLALFLDFYHPKFTFAPRGFVLLTDEDRIIYPAYSKRLLANDFTISKIQKLSLNQYLLA